MSSDPSNFQKYKLLIEFDGTDFCGWQLQKDSRTVQGCIEEALAPLFSVRPRITGAGRTDSGVHATGMVAHFKAAEDRNAETILKALNANLPPDIRILKVQIADRDFHARFHAKWRGYVYRIRSEQRAIGRQYSWYLPDKLNLDDLNKLASEVLGDHCFRSFSHERPDEEHYRSRIYRATWEKESEDLLFRIDGIRFLHGMVRLLVGTMLDITRGSLEFSNLQQIIEKKDVRFAGTKAPAHGLTLTAVGYHDWPQL
ncbi:tRNA pseudouridine(38-40) synthase TruA [bacterium]|nr:MAG: tRNA pseudouridine(38-40) synthase TruA [bacterium]